MTFPLKNMFLRASTLKRLWMGAGAVAIFIGTLFVIQAFLPGDSNDQVLPGLHLKCDFIAFYTGGAFVRDGRGAELYDIPKIHAFQVQLLRAHGIEIGTAIGPWWNPPFYAWVFAPLARLSYPHALETWVGFNLCCCAAATVLLCRIIIKAHREGRAKRSMLATGGTFASGAKVWLLVPVLILLSTPFIHALSHGQNSCTSLLLVTLAVVCWRGNRAIAGGFFTGLMFYKPQLGAVLSVVLVLSLGWRCLIGIGTAGVLLLGASLALPGSLPGFIHQMPRNLHFVQCDVPYLWDRHVTFKAFWRLLLQGNRAGEPTNAVTILSTICSAALAAGLLWAAFKGRRDRRRIDPAIEPDASPSRQRDRLIAATLTATPLLMPFYFDYDQLLLAIPAVLLAADIISRDRKTRLIAADRWLLCLWPAYYAWLMLNSDIASLTRVNLTVVLLTAVCGLMIQRATRRRGAREVHVAPRLSGFEQRLVAA